MLHVSWRKLTFVKTFHARYCPESMIFMFDISFVKNCFHNQHDFLLTVETFCSSFYHSYVIIIFRETLSIVVFTIHVKWKVMCNFVFKGFHNERKNKWMFTTSPTGHLSLWNCLPDTFIDARALSGSSPWNMQKTKKMGQNPSSLFWCGMRGFGTLLPILRLLFSRLEPLTIKPSAGRLYYARALSGSSP